ncbi:MAG: fibronectin type III domain-containing protein [Oscillospiraceae bacterium]
MKKLIRGLAVLTAVFSLTCANVMISPEKLTVYAEEELSASEVSDISPYSLSNLTVSLRKKSFMTKTADGYMRVFYDKNNNRIIAEYYSDSLDIISRKTIDMELSVWGGFYEGADAYYLIEGENNLDELDSAEVIRVIKYDKQWNRLGAAAITANTSLFGGQVRYPFDYGCVEAAEYDGTLYIVTGHQGYVDPTYNMGHQGFLMAAVDEASMTGSIIKTDLWHSFAQYIAHDDDYSYILEQSEGSGYTKLSKYDRTKNSSTSIPVLEYGGDRSSAWAISCYATVDGIALSEDNILAVGTSIDQSDYDNYSSDMPYNIYLTVTPKSNFSQEATEIKWLTGFEDNGQRFGGVTITKITDDRFMLMWSQKYEDKEASADTDDLLSANTVHYLFIDGSGNKLGSEYTASAAFSDCKPVLKGSKLVYYASNGYAVDIYSIDAYTGEFSKKCFRTAGENAQWSYEDKTLTISGSGDMFSGGSWGNIASQAEKIVIKKGITTIPDSTFAHFSNLQEVRIENGVKSIGAKAFYYCTRLLNKVYIPSSVEYIGDDFLWTGYYWTSDYSKVVYAAIYAPTGSYAAQYAADNNIKFVADDPSIEAPANVKVSGSGRVTWDAAENAVKYRVTITYGGSSYVSDYLTDTEYTPSSVPSCEYTVTVTAYDSSGNSAESKAVTVLSLADCIKCVNSFISQNDDDIIIFDEELLFAVERVLYFDYQEAK